jgi:hypothetical protein
MRGPVSFAARLRRVGRGIYRIISTKIGVHARVERPAHTLAAIIFTIDFIYWLVPGGSLHESSLWKIKSS